MAAHVELRVLSGSDRGALEAELELARSRGDLRASSDPELAFTMQHFAISPEWFGAAFAGDALVGLVIPDIKIAVVRPEHRRAEIGRRLIELGLGIQARIGRTDLYMGSVPEDPGGAAFLQATGFTFHSVVWDLDLPSEAAVPAPVWPAGLIARPFDRARDIAALPAIVNVAFADHPTPIVMEPAMIEASLDDPNLRDEDVLLVEDPALGELVGFCLMDVRRSDGAVTSSHGEIGMVGVRPDRQGQGLGRQLLRGGATYLRGIGVPDVGLAVNARNEGALGLYESEGYVRVRTRDRWSRAVPATAAPA